MRSLLKNKHGLPDWLVTVVEKTNDQYDPGEKTDYSISSLLTPPNIYTLEKEHDPEPDVADMLQSFVGTAVHDKIEEKLKDDPRYLIEERLYFNLHIPEAPTDKKDFVISAQLDLYDKETKEHCDHKNSKLWSFTKEKAEYNAQLAFQRFLLRREGYEVKQSYIGGFAGDWGKRKTLYDKNYPKVMWMRVDYPDWDDEVLLEWLKEKVLGLEYAKIGQIRMCSPEERWRTADEYVVKKVGSKNAIRGSKTRDRSKAEAMAEEKGKAYYVEDRPGEDIRCKTSFCPVKDYCEYYKKHYGKKKRSYKPKPKTFEFKLPNTK